MTIRRHILVLSLVAVFAVGTPLVPRGDARAQEEQENAQEEQQWQGISKNECYAKCAERHQTFLRKCLAKEDKKES